MIDVAPTAVTNLVTRPMVGYLNARGSTPRRLRQDANALERFASRQGYTLRHVFVEPDCGGPVSMLRTLISTAARCRAVVGVPHALDLGADGFQQSLLIRRIEDETQGPVLIIADLQAQVTVIRRHRGEPQQIAAAGRLRWM